MKPQRIPIACAILPVVAALLHGGACLACEGAELEQAERLRAHMEFVSRTCNESGTVDDSLRCLEEEWGYTVQKLDKLPESCRELLKEFEPEAE